MDSKQKHLRLKIIIPSIILWLSVNLYYFWVKIAGGVFIVTGIIELVCFLTVIIATIILVIKIIRHQNWRNLKNFLAIALTVIVMTVLNISQLRINENTFQSPIIMRACYEDTMNTSQLYFRENGSFEDFNIGFFAFVHYRKGAWTQHGDTLFLNFIGEGSRMLGRKNIIRDESLYKIQADTLVPTYYYMGYCKGLN